MNGFNGAVEDFVESFLRGRLHTAQPGEIVKVVSANPPIVNVQPGFMRLREGSDEAEKRPVIPNVPLIFPVFGDFGITSSVKVGMTVLLIAAERSIKPWMEQGTTVDPTATRIFDLSDCVAIPGLPNKKTDWVVPDEGIQIGSIDGATIVKIADGKITTKADETVLQEGADYAVQFTALKTAFDTLKGDFNNLVTLYSSHVHPGVLVGGASTLASIAPGVPSSASMDSAKVTEVRLP